MDRAHAGGPAVDFGAVAIGSVGCRADSAVFLAALDGEPADAAEPRGPLAGARAIRPVAIAPVVVLVDDALEHVGGSLERGQLRAAEVDLDPALAESGTGSLYDAPHVASRSRRRRRRVVRRRGIPRAPSRPLRGRGWPDSGPIRSTRSPRRSVAVMVRARVGA